MTPIELSKRLEEVRLLESRKSARLMDQDTDFARLADMAGDRKKTSSHSIDVPFGQGSIDVSMGSRTRKGRSGGIVSSFSTNASRMPWLLVSLEPLTKAPPNYPHTPDPSATSS
ncbi:hypothetical protein RUM44_003995 [Polyplax serrata]|uniref:Uncharacterized protein n=1 Tax=Polyplax serrata TaxID=468196 RepID=A0ABR1B358_POLSC